VPFLWVPGSSNDDTHFDNICARRSKKEHEVASVGNAFMTRATCSGKETEKALASQCHPTILDLAGLKLPNNIQGRFVRPTPAGKHPDDWRQSIYYHDYEPRGKHHVPLHYAFRTDRFKLLHY